ncbi:MAG: glycosyltransferase [Oscillospiraceae bacterium]|nr:glycosyltransferase [Oscillospiraceae bacterium]
MKLSVIIPVYKAEAFLNECVDSLLGQTLRDMEIILVDDGSPDGSGAIMADYAARFPERVRTLTLSNGGQGRARNRGMDLARGEYLGFVDSDDYVVPEMYETLVRAAEAGGADIVDCSIEAFTPDGRTELLRTWREGKPVAAAGSACNKLFRRAFVGETRFPEGLKYEDFGFTAELLLRSAKTVHLPDALYRYRVGQPSTMHNADSRMNLDLLEVMEGLRERMDPEKDRDDFEFLLLNHVLLDAVKRVAAQEGPERAECLFLLRSYVKEHIPRLSACRSFREESRNRRIVMRLNYLGLHDLALKLLELKGRTAD